MAPLKPTSCWYSTTLHLPSYSIPEVGFEQFRVAEKAHGSWMKLYMEGNTSEVLSNLGKKVLKQYLEALASMSSALSKQLGKYDMYSMVAGMMFVFQVSTDTFHWCEINFVLSF